MRHHQTSLPALGRGVLQGQLTSSSSSRCTLLPPGGRGGRVEEEAKAEERGERREEEASGLASGSLTGGCLHIDLIFLLLTSCTLQGYLATLQGYKTAPHHTQKEGNDAASGFAFEVLQVF